MSLESIVERLANDLDALDVPWVLVGGLAFIVHVRARFTHDVDVAVALQGTAEEDRLVRDLNARGYRLYTGPINREETDRLFGVRLVPPGENPEQIVTDVLFAASGIEKEAVTAAQRLPVFPGLTLPVVTKGHLLAMKLLSWRDQDRVDAKQLAAIASGREIDRARHAVRLMEERGLVKEAGVLDARLEALLSEDAP